MLTDTVLDIDQFINTDLFAQAHSSPATASSSPSSPEQGLLTPPQAVPAPTFHDAGDGLGSFSLFDDELKVIDPLNGSPYDFLSGSSTSLDHPMSGYPPMDLGFGSLSGMAGLHMNSGVDMGLNMPIVPLNSDLLQQMVIDPQLMNTPASTAPISDFGDEEDDHEGDDEQSSQNTSIGASPASSASSPIGGEGERERLTLTIAPIKVGGHGKARRGTVQSGGVVKKIATMPLLRDKENAISSAAFSSGARTSALLSVTATNTSVSALPSPGDGSPASPSMGKNLPKPPTILKASAKKGKAKEIDEDDDDDVPQDWRPSPEVFAKMTSKEKRQLRNKISARNFRVRRKEYITTLEGDIAERDRLLDAIRSELGSTQSENLALRQEITALKKILLEGRGTADLPSLNLPPPAPLPVGLPAAATAIATNSIAAPSAEGMVPSPPNTPTPHQQTNATAATANSVPNPFAPNTQKDLPSSPTPRPFWGGQHHPSLLGGMGGITPVHTTLVPEVNVGSWGFNAKKVLGDSAGMNINPLLNAIGAGVTGTAALRKREDEKVKLTGFDAFADANLFTMKSLDAYRMHLWGRMAAQHQAQQYLLPQQSTSQSQLVGPAASLRPAHFVTPSLASLISGKPSTSSTNALGLLTPPASPRLGSSSKALPSSSQSLSSSAAQSAQQQREREAQAAVLAVVASQTLFKKLGSAFWDAFSGSSPSSTPSPNSATPVMNMTARNWDADKVRKVLEGKAVVKVVDVEPTPAPALPVVPTLPASTRCCEEVKCTVSEILEESMRSLTLGKGSGSSRRH